MSNKLSEDYKTTGLWKIPVELEVKAIGEIGRLLGVYALFIKSNSR